MNRSTIILAALAALAGCGGGGSGGGTGPASLSPKTAATSLVAIGNSLTFVPEQAGWAPGRGMAASTLATDYVHVAAQALGLPVGTQRNAASLELPADDPINAIDTVTPIPQQIAAAVAGIDSGTDVVVELGDNAWKPPATPYQEFAANYAALLDAVTAQHPHGLACVSTWWADAAKDAMIAAECAAHGGAFVAIGDIFPTRTDAPAPGEDPRIWGHPHDPSMAIIGARVAAALGSAR